MSRVPYSPRPATAEDLNQIAEIESRSIACPWSFESFASEIGKPHTIFWVVTDNETDQKIMAYAVASFPGDQAHLQTFAVHPEFRRKGLGLYLLRQLISHIMRRKGNSLVLEVRKGNEAAIRLYQLVGFNVIRSLPKFYPDGEDAFSMIYNTAQNRLQGDTQGAEPTDFDEDPEATNGKKNFN